MPRCLRAAAPIFSHMYSAVYPSKPLGIFPFDTHTHTYSPTKHSLYGYSCVCFNSLFITHAHPCDNSARNEHTPSAQQIIAHDDDKRIYWKCTEITRRVRQCQNIVLSIINQSKKWRLQIMRTHTHTEYFIYRCVK